MERHNHADISNYTPVSEGGMERASDAVKYFVHRGDEAGATQYRSGFDSESGGLSKETMLSDLSRAGEAGGRYVYTVVLSPDHQAGARDLKEYTREVVDGTLRERHGDSMTWKAIIHDNQNAHPHVHVVLVTRVTLNKSEFRQFNRQVDARWTGGEAQRREPERQERGQDGWTR